MARPKKDIDEKRVTDLASEGCSNRCIGDILGVSEHTISRRFGALLDKKRAERRHAIRKLQMKVAESGNATMLIWLGKNELGQSDHPVHSGNPEPEVDPKMG